MTDLYALLGLARGASPAEVRRAYRKKAKTEHPDAGGSPDRFSELALAHRILTDEGKRQRYDDTGATNDEPDRRHAQAMELVMQTIDQVLSGPDAIYADVIAQAKAAVRMRISEYQTNEANVKREIERLTKLRKRFAAKSGKVDRIGAMLQSKVDNMGHMLLQIAETIGICESAVTILDDHTFKAEARPAPTPTFWAGGQGVNTYFSQAGIGR